MHHSKQDIANPWLYVELLRKAKIYQIKIVNRVRNMECLNPMNILIGNFTDIWQSCVKGFDMSNLLIKSFTCSMEYSVAKYVKTQITGERKTLNF